MTFWSGERLTAEGKKLRIVDSFNEDKVDCSAYTLTLGPEAFVTPDYSVSQRDNVRTILTAPFEVELGGGMRNITGGELVIPSGQFAILLTEEFVRIPKHTMGFISLKFSVKGTGLINVSGFHVDPGYEGRLIFSVYNAGPSPARMNRGQDLFLLWLADLDRQSEAPFVKPPAKNPVVSIPTTMIAKADRPIRSAQELSDKVDELDAELKLFKRMVGVAAVILATSISFAALIIASIRFFGESPILNSI